MRRRRPRRAGWSTPGPVYRTGPAARLTGTAFLIWWAAVLVVVALDRRDATVLARTGTLTALLLGVVLPNLRATVAASPLGLRVNNGWRERNLRWRDVVRFEAELSGGGGRVVAILRTGEALRLAATRCRPLTSRRHRRRQVEARRKRLASYQSLLLADVTQSRI